MSLKKLLILLTVLILFVIIFLRFLSPEDIWLCQNGSWVKHGNPSQGKPLTVCPRDKKEIDNSPKVCTMEAKLCPDGSSVGRSGPNCEFTPCPEN